MGLPQSRDATYGASDPVSSSTTNKLQDCVVGHKHGLITRVISAHAGIALSSTGALGAGSFSALTFGAPNFFPWLAGAVGQLLVFSLPLFAGERLLNLRGLVACGAGDTLGFEARSVDPTIGTTGNFTYITGGSSAGHAGNIESIALNGLNVVAIAGHSYIAQFECTARATAPLVWGLEMDVDCPP